MSRVCLFIILFLVSIIVIIIIIGFESKIFY